MGVGINQAGLINESEGAVPVKKKRSRRTKAQMAQLRQAIMDVLSDPEDRPATVRGVFYRVVSAGEVPKTDSGYDAVQSQVLELRREGVMPYSWISDGTRFRLRPQTWTDVDQALEDVAASYRRALWRDQPTYVEIWSEKDAITGIIRPITERWDVPLLIARGFASETFLWQAASEITRIGKPTIIYQLGDHDPSGIHSWMAAQKKLREFAPDIDMTFERLAVTPEQIDQLGLLTRRTKLNPRHEKWWPGGESCEVDAIPSRVLRSIVENAILQCMDEHRLDITLGVEESERAGLESFSVMWAMNRAGHHV
jgi:hypothetical protein